MQKLSYSQIANLLLVVALVTLVAAFPFSRHFLGGLFTAMGSAGLIAGLADWFAVTALFRKPLGLPYPAFIPTAIVPRNRERLLQALVSMVEEELLTKENLRRQLGEIDLAGLLLDYVNQPPIAARLKTLLGRTVDYFVDQLDQEHLNYLVHKIVADHLEPEQLKPLLSQLINVSQSKGYDDKVLTLLMDSVLQAMDYQQLHQWLTKVLEGAMVRYAKGLTRRQLAGSVLVSAFAQADSPRFRRELRQTINTLLGTIHRKAKDRLSELGENPDLLQAVTELLKEQIDLNPEALTTLRELVQDKLARLWDEYTVNPAAQETLNNQLRQYLFQLIDSRHYLIGRLVRETLYRFDDQTLADFVEAKAGKDLQVIRISGTLVGGGAGALLYLLTFWLGGY